jgi:hypothetical protein
MRGFRIRPRRPSFSKDARRIGVNMHYTGSPPQSPLSLTHASTHSLEAASSVPLGSSPGRTESCGPIRQKLESSFEKYELSQPEVNRTIVVPPFCKHSPLASTSPSIEKTTRVDSRNQQTTIVEGTPQTAGLLHSSPAARRADRYFDRRPTAVAMLY